MSSVFTPLSILVISRSQTISTRLERVLRDANVVHDIHHIGGYLLAISALGSELADSLPTVIVGDGTLLRHDIASTVAALHEQAPTSRVMLISDEDQVPELQTCLAGMNVAIASTEQSDDQLLAMLINVRDASDSNPQSNVVADAQDEDRADLQSVGQSDGQFDGPAGSKADTRPRRSDSVDWEATAHTPPQDVQLIRELMNPHGNLHDKAVARVLEHCNVPGVRFITSEPNPAQNAVPVTMDGQHFGHLTAPHDPNSDADTSKLQLWADWLAHWFALEKQRNDLWQMAMRDELTGAWNRRYFNRFLQRIVQHAHDHRTSVTLMIFDIDDFKSYNDKYGHAAGDEILRETARLMQSAVRDQDVVARIGGDEFGVIFWDAEAPRRAGSRHPGDVRGICERFKKMILGHKFPKLLHEAAGTLTISAGLAGFPWDAKSAEELIERADAMALTGKREGKNAIKFGPGLLKNGHGHSD